MRHKQRLRIEEKMKVIQEYLDRFVFALFSLFFPQKGLFNTTGSNIYVRLEYYFFNCSS